MTYRTITQLQELEGKVDITRSFPMPWRRKWENEHHRPLDHVNGRNWVRLGKYGVVLVFRAVYWLFRRGFGMRPRFLKHWGIWERWSLIWFDLIPIPYRRQLSLECQAVFFKQRNRTMDPIPEVDWLAWSRGTIKIKLDFSEKLPSDRTQSLFPSSNNQHRKNKPDLGPHT